VAWLLAERLSRILGAAVAAWDVVLFVDSGDAAFLGLAVFIGLVTITPKPGGRNATG
jgi:hypothetical protein